MANTLPRILEQKPAPKCRVCGKPCRARLKKSKLGFITYLTHCNTCIRRIYRKKNRAYRKFLKDKCEFCGFMPIHTCQLDIDHKDGNHSNNKPENLQTLCANCHRLKTQVSKDWKNSTNEKWH